MSAQAKSADYPHFQHRQPQPKVKSSTSAPHHVTLPHAPPAGEADCAVCRRSAMYREQLMRESTQAQTTVHKRGWQKLAAIRGGNVQLMRGPRSTLSTRRGWQKLAATRRYIIPLYH